MENGQPSSMIGPLPRSLTPSSAPCCRSTYTFLCRKSSTRLPSTRRSPITPTNDGETLARAKATSLWRRSERSRIGSFERRTKPADNAGTDPYTDRGHFSWPERLNRRHARSSLETLDQSDFDLSRIAEPRLPGEMS